MFQTVKNLTDAERAKWIAQHPIQTVEGRVLSPTNQVLISYQKQDATLVGGFNQWKQAGRHVRKGESSISIWFPSLKKTDGGDDGETQTNFFYRLGF